MLQRAIFAVVIIPMLLSCHKNPATPPQNNGEDSTNNGEDVTLTTRVVADNLTFPWDIFYGPDNHIWMSERGGRISRVNPQTGEVTQLKTISDVKTRGEGGLLGIALTVPIDGMSFLFAVYNYEDGSEYKQKIVRYEYSNNSLSQEMVIHDGVRGAGIHNGSRLVISPDGKLLASTGDASNPPSAQDFGGKNGKILRMNFDGTVPSDNPLPNSTVWTAGHRNPQGLVYVHDTLFSSEHGPDSDDEINIIHRGRNYGWPDIVGKCDNENETLCDGLNVVEPLINWTPTIAVSGMEYYDSDEIPQWKNSLLVCTLKDETLYQLKLNAAADKIEETKTFFRSQWGRLRDVCASPDGKVYVCTSNGEGDVLVEISKKD